MAKSSPTKKVAKVARTGGGRTAKRGAQRSVFFPTMLGVVVVMGVFLIGFSRAERQPDTTRPRIGSDHWHAAIAFDICGTIAPNMPQEAEDPLGIHTHSDGIVHVHPFSSQSAGKKAVLDVWFHTAGIKLTDNELKLPNQDAKRNGDRCEAGPGTLQMKVWDSRSPTDSGRVITSDFGKLRLKDSQLITVTFLPEGAEIPRPPSESQLDRLSDVGTPTPTTVAGETTTSTPSTSTPASSTPATTGPATTGPADSTPATSAPVTTAPAPPTPVP